VGDVIDWWRIEAVDPGARLLLQAAMLLPGRVWLQFEVTETEGRSVIRHTTMFDTVGLGGLLIGACPTRSIISSSGNAPGDRKAGGARAFEADSPRRLILFHPFSTSLAGTQVPSAYNAITCSSRQI
jgi:Protein of unknown function (DUF2867)